MKVVGEKNSEPLIEAIEQLSPHDHLCLIYKTREEQFSAVVPYILIGLERGEKCTYIADDNTAAEVMDAMHAGGIDVDSNIKSGALVILSKKDAYLKQGSFDPDWMIKFIEETTKAALDEGYSALRVTGEMTWVLGGDPGTERLFEYEAKLNYMFPKIRAHAICQYNAERFKPEIIIDVIRTHPMVIYGNVVCRNFYYVPPDEFLKAGQLSLEVERLLENILDRERKEMELQNSEAALKQTLEETIESFAKTVGARDPYTSRHQLRVAQLAPKIGGRMSLPRERIDGIRLGSIIHDIGKIQVPAEILSKPSRLSEIEYMVVCEHPRVGYEILKDISFPWPVVDIAYQHHERMDGSGYPQGLKGDEICLEARIVAVADVVEAMSSHRPYRPALGLEAALDEIMQHRGTLYDARVVDACVKLFREDGYKLEI